MFTQPEAAQATKDEPLGDATAPRLLYLSPSAPATDQIGAISGPVVVEAYINGEGAGLRLPHRLRTHDAQLARRWKTCCFGSHFEPARFFGQPVRGLAVLSFSGVSVRG